MHAAEFYSHKDGEAYIREHHARELRDVLQAIEQLDAATVLRKVSAEAGKPLLIFSPVELNLRMKKFLSQRGWTEPAPGTAKGFREPRISLGDHEFREMDGLKNRVGLEIQFGKYAFMGYDIFSKMPMFAIKGLIDCGIEVVVTPAMIPHMSTGVSSFEQIKTDMQIRGAADTDIPTLVIGFQCSAEEWKAVAVKRSRFELNRDEMIANGEVAAPRRGAKPGPK